MQALTYAPLALFPLCAAPALAQGAGPLFTNGVTVLSEADQFQKVIDLDHDGSPEVLSWFWNAQTLPDHVILKGYEFDVEGSLEELWTLASPTLASAWCGSACTGVGDFDGDGFDDFALAFGYEVFVYATQPGGPPVLIDTQIIPTLFYIAEVMATPDLDDDGLDDLIVGCDRGVHSFLSQGTGLGFLGSSSSGGSTSSVRTPELVVLDYDADGREEIAVKPSRTSGTTSIRLYGYDGVELAYDGSIQNDMPTWTGLTGGDIDGDGDDDLVLFEEGSGVGSGTFQVLRANGSNFAVETRSPGGPATHLFDIDADGDLDGLCCGGSGCNFDNDDAALFRICLNDGTGAFDRSIIAQGLESGYDGLAGVIDIDGDGDEDLIGGRSVLINLLGTGAPYCEPGVNSIGLVGQLHMSGTSSLARSDLVLHATDLPAEVTSLILLGNRAGAIPIGAGTLCVATPFHRLALTAADPQGQFDHALPTASFPIQFPGAIEAGATRRFQVWHRDSGPDGSSFAFSRGIRVTFAP